MIGFAIIVKLINVEYGRKLRESKKERREGIITAVAMDPLVEAAGQVSVDLPIQVTTTFLARFLVHPERDRGEECCSTKRLR